MKAHSNNTGDHITPLRVYLTVATALLILTAVTVRISLINLGGWNLVVALAVATLKATLVALFFMHLLYDKKIYMIVFGVGIVFLAIFIALTMFDTLERGAVNPIEAGSIKKSAVIYDHNTADTTRADSTGHH
jgi:cytochrome c oxidase subunit IV